MAPPAVPNQSELPRKTSLCAWDGAVQIFQGYQSSLIPIAGCYVYSLFSVALHWGSLHGAEILYLSGRALLPQYFSGFPIVPAQGDSCISPYVSRSSYFRSATLLWSFKIIALKFSCKASPGLGTNRWRFQMQPSWNSHVFFLNFRGTTDLVVHRGILKIILVSSLSLTSPHFVNHHILSFYFLTTSHYPFHSTLASHSSSDFKIK